jgi:hopene-associated glycosyltransferase HpnB
MVWLGIVVVLIWVALWLGWGAYWRIEIESVSDEPANPSTWPAVVVVIPARNEAGTIAATLKSLWSQAYPGPFRIVVVDDHSEDETNAAAWRTAVSLGTAGELTVLAAEPLPHGWAGKVWAMDQGYRRCIPADDPAVYVLFSDADIEHGPGVLRELVRRAESGRLDLSSLMVRLHCGSVSERLMIPAFVFFFRLLYPFRWVNNPNRKTAGAAGGTMLVRRAALDRIGGPACIRGALIDDCALAAAIKRGGHPIWLGLSDSSRSTRGYGSLAGILRMIARTAYTQLRYSPAALLLCVLGLALTFLAPPLLVLAGHGSARTLGGVAWVMMSALYLPMVRFYRLCPLWSLSLPLTSVLYLWATLCSAYSHHRGRGEEWKGRTQQG